MLTILGISKFLKNEVYLKVIQSRIIPLSFYTEVVQFFFRPCGLTTNLNCVLMENFCPCLTLHYLCGTLLGPTFCSSAKNVS